MVGQKTCSLHKILTRLVSTENAVDWSYISYMGFSHSSVIGCSRDVINGTYSSWVTLIVQLLVARVVPTAVVPRSIDNSLHWSLESTYTEKKTFFLKTRLKVLRSNAQNLKKWSGRSLNPNLIQFGFFSSNWISKNQ